MNHVKLTKSESRTVCSYENIPKYRDEKCFSQEYIAQQLEIRQSTYQRIEAGKVKISTDRLSQLARIFNKPIEAFFGNGKKPSTEDQEKELLKEILTQREERIRELEEKIQRRDNKICELKQLIK